MNPFLVPQTGRRSGRPLCPWVTREHSGYYVPVDSTEVAFDQFKRQVRLDEEPADQGRLVIVFGESGCGKTSLINRCADHLQQTLSAQGTLGLIVDLTEERVSSVSVDSRMLEVSVLLVNALRERSLLPASQRFGEPASTSALIYRQISNALAELSAVLVVLLPPTEDLADELPEYARLARKRIIFFAESSSVDVMRDCLDGIKPAARDEIIVLEVGPLRADDGWMFVQDRLARRTDISGPTVSQETITRAVEALSPMSVGRLQSLLFGLWEDVSERSPSFEEIRFEDFLLYYIRLANLHPRRFAEPRSQQR